MKPTPDYKAWYNYSDSVYEPSEDTFVFLDGLEVESERRSFGLCVELGTGSGLVSAAVEKWTKSAVIGIDINQQAAQCTRQLLLDNKCTR